MFLIRGLLGVSWIFLIRGLLDVSWMFLTRTFTLFLHKSFHLDYNSEFESENDFIRSGFLRPTNVQWQH